MSCVYAHVVCKRGPLEKADDADQNDSIARNRAQFDYMHHFAEGSRTFTAASRSLSLS